MIIFDRAIYIITCLAIKLSIPTSVIACSTTSLHNILAKMRYKTIIYPLLTASFAVTVFSQQQRPMADKNLGPALPPSVSAPADGDTVILSDVLGNDRSINIFAGFTRDFANISQRFEDSSLNTTILAPVNSAVMALPRKPWEDPEDYDRLGPNAYEGEPGEERAQRNLRRFVEAHVLPVSPWKEGEKVKTLAGGEVWWEDKDGVKMASTLDSYDTPRKGLIDSADQARRYRGQLDSEQGIQWGSLDLEGR